MLQSAHESSKLTHKLECIALLGYKFTLSALDINSTRYLCKREVGFTSSAKNCLFNYSVHFSTLVKVLQYEGERLCNPLTKNKNKNTHKCKAIGLLVSQLVVVLIYGPGSDTLSARSGARLHGNHWRDIDLSCSSCAGCCYCLTVSYSRQQTLI